MNIGWNYELIFFLYFLDIKIIMSSSYLVFDSKCCQIVNKNQDDEIVIFI